MIEHGLPQLEQRRHVPLAQLTDLVARAIWPKDREPLPWQDWLPPYARDEHSHPVPAWVRRDLKVGLRLGLISQDLYDTVKQLSS
ncbi:MAG TPA: hypothetical protein VFN07_01035 [Trueperaceae bacterium]|nr:hypothetical protein [Trueperaceae bacterium]